MNFGTVHQQKIEKITIENEYLQVEVMTLGATLVSFVEKQTQLDVVLGFGCAQGYLDQHGSYLGATVGRCANRIGKGKFTLNGVEYHVPINNNGNSLHGGNNNFAFQVFDLIHVDQHEVVLRYVSKDGEEGYPGNLVLTITYRLDKDKLCYEIEGTCDQDTILNVTNHSYFNLNGSHTASILSHEMQIDTDRVALVDQDGLTLDKVIDVKDSGFDFRRLCVIKDQLKRSHENIKLAGGYDHHYVFENRTYKRMAFIRGEQLQMEVYSDYPGMHVYSGNFLDGACKGKEGRYYGEKNGICFECQYYPNAINYEAYIKPILRKNETMKHCIEYRLTKREEEHEV